MTKEHISTGKTIDDAVDNGLSFLNLDRDDVSIEVLETPSKGFLGIGSTLAKIKISYEAPDEIKQEPKAVANHEKKETPVKKQKDINTKEVQVKPESKNSEVDSEKTVLSSSEAEKIKQFVSELIIKMGVTGCDVTVSQKEDYSLWVNVKGDDGGAIIGRHGETLDAIQYIISLFVNKNKEKAFIRVNFDSGNYRFKRKETLERLARSKASAAIKKKGSIILEPMQAYERRIIHASLQNHSNITTYSVGEEPRRKVVIAYQK